MDDPATPDDTDLVVSPQEKMGELVATRSVRWEAVRRLDEEQIKNIVELESMNVESLRERWGDSFP